MKFNKLGSSEIKVSEVCLGSMTWGVQNNQSDANQQIEQAISRGVNFIDTAELYPVPPTGEKYGDTEQIIGNYLSANKQKRTDIVLATKIAGNGLPWIRESADIDGDAIIKSVDASLKRLQTDYIDLYQLHWPNRTSPHFSKHRPNAVKFSDSDNSKLVGSSDGELFGSVDAGTFGEFLKDNLDYQLYSSDNILLISHL